MNNKIQLNSFYGYGKFSNFTTNSDVLSWYSPISLVVLTSKEIKELENINSTINWYKVPNKIKKVIKNFESIHSYKYLPEVVKMPFIKCISFIKAFNTLDEFNFNSIPKNILYHNYIWKELIELHRLGIIIKNYQEYKMYKNTLKAIFNDSKNYFNFYYLGTTYKEKFTYYQYYKDEKLFWFTRELETGLKRNHFKKPVLELHF